MTLETYLAIALLQMGHDAMQTYNAKMHYRVVSSLMLALLWPITNALMVAGVVIRQRRSNDAIQGPRIGSAGMEG